jgi:hypothetical protein
MQLPFCFHGEMLRQSNDLPEEKLSMNRYVKQLAKCTWGMVYSIVLVLAASGTFAEEPKLLIQPDAFQTLVNPQCSHCRDEAKRRAGELRDDDRVLCWIRGYSDGGTIPIRFFLNTFRVISDSYGVFVYDPDAGFARGFAPSYDFTFHGWRNGVMVMKHKDGTLYSCLTGKAFAGPKKGEQLQPVPTLVSNWGDWLQRYPQAVAYHMFDKYKPVDLPAATNESSQKSRGRVDERLPADERVLGVARNERARAYRFEDIADARLINDTIDQQSIVIFWNDETQTAAAFETIAEPPEKVTAEPHMIQLQFDRERPSSPFVDTRTGSHWDIAGRCIDGKLAGWTLRWLDSTQVKWYAWAAEYGETEIYSPDSSRTGESNPDKHSSLLRSAPLELVLVDPDTVNARQIEEWQREGFSALGILLDEEHGADAYARAAAAAAFDQMDVYYWIEIARNPRIADAHPRLMASLGMHDDWQARFPATNPPKKGQVAKAYPWVPIAYSDAFQSHLNRVKRLLEIVPASYRGLLLNDLQGGPAACGCGNLQCRWAIDYGVPATATAQGVDDAAARFVTKVRGLAPSKQVVPIWMTECEASDLPMDKAPGGRSTGLCGSVACATGECPKAFRRQLTSLVKAHPESLGLLVSQKSSGRDAGFYGGPTGWIPAAVDYLDATPVSADGRHVPHDRLWLVVQGAAAGDEGEIAARAEARRMHPRAIIAARIPLDQSYEPRIMEAQ